MAMNLSQVRGDVSVSSSGKAPTVRSAWTEEQSESPCSSVGPRSCSSGRSTDCHSATRDTQVSGHPAKPSRKGKKSGFWSALAKVFCHTEQSAEVIDPLDLCGMAAAMEPLKVQLHATAQARATEFTQAMYDAVDAAFMPKASGHAVYVTEYGQSLEAFAKAAFTNCARLRRQQDRVAALDTLLEDARGVGECMVDLLASKLAAIGQAMHSGDSLESLRLPECCPVVPHGSHAPKASHAAAAACALTLYTVLVMRWAMEEYSNTAIQLALRCPEEVRDLGRAVYRNTLLLTGTINNQLMQPFNELCPVLEVAAVW